MAARAFQTKFRKALRSIRDYPPVLTGLVHLLRGLRALGIPPGESVYRHVPFKGVFNVAVPDGSSFRMYAGGHQIENRLFWSGIFGHEPRSMRVWIALARNARTVIDVGANTGVFGLAAAAAGARRVYGFEALPRVFEVYRRNVGLNSHLDLHAVNCAIGRERGRATLYDPGGDLPSSASLSREFADARFAASAIGVEVRALDEFFATRHLDDVDLVKIDVEGYEEQVLHGMKDTLRRNAPTILLEVLAGYEQRLKRTVGNLVKNGYHWVPIEEERGVAGRNVVLVSRHERPGDRSRVEAIIHRPDQSSD